MYEKSVGTSVRKTAYVKMRGGERGAGGAAIFRIAQLAAAVCITGIISCAEVEYPYRYISLEQLPGIVVDKIGPVTLEGLRGGKSVPLEYRLLRGNYVLHFAVIKESAHPAVRVAVAGRNYFLKFRPDPNARAPNGVLCASYYPAAAASFDFGWEAGCTASQLPKTIDFDVLDGNGNVIASEHIVFSLKENGTYTAVDAI